MTQSSMDNDNQLITLTSDVTGSWMIMADWLLTENDSSPIIIKCTGQWVSNDDIVQNGMIVEVLRS